MQHRYGFKDRARETLEEVGGRARGSVAVRVALAELLAEIGDVEAALTELGQVIPPTTDAAMELAGGFGASDVRCHVACGLAWVAYCQHAVASSYVDRNCDDDTPRDISLSCEFELIGSRCAKCARALSLTSAPATP